MPRLRKGWAALAAFVGPDEVVLVAGLGLATGGLWAIVGPPALTLPGLVLLWIGIPQRASFVARSGDEKTRRVR